MPEITPPMHQTGLAVTTGLGVATNTVKGSSGPAQGPIVSNLPTQQVQNIAFQRIRVTINWINAATGTGLNIGCTRTQGTIVVGTTLTHNVPAGIASYQITADFIDTNVPPGSTYTINLAALTIAGTAADVVASCNDFT